jgi:hypothetical protein
MVARKIERIRPSILIVEMGFSVFDMVAPSPSASGQRAFPDRYSGRCGHDWQHDFPGVHGKRVDQSVMLHCVIAHHFRSA